jgi:serine/threonine protein kinase/tetratricopeptide (TPR) repeat protein
VTGKDTDSDRERDLAERARALVGDGEGDSTSSSDPAVLDEVAALLAADALAQASGEPSPAQHLAAELEPGTRLGPYRLLERIGEGGFGTVYLAEQREPIRRRVALKVIKLGMDTRQVIARFEAERQALALMTHSNIARVLDVGATDSGRPYFVMELVSGVPITDYCERLGLGVDQRLELFVSVCRAIQHAHSKGVIHRDIKPSNILVGEESGHAMAKVIDFGIAKATLTDLTDKTLLTMQEQLIGTPAYMPPEQAEQSRLDVDTRSDIYALGVLLYELMTGVTPFDRETLQSASRTEMLRIIREVEPRRPSTRVLSADDEGQMRRRPPGPDLARRLSGDLDWIVMKCLEKDRTRRYETASELAAEIQRHLEHEPVLASAPSALYRLRKLARRHRAAVIGGATALTLLIVAIVGTTWGWLEAEAARAESQQRADQLERVANLQEAQLRRVDGAMLGLGLRDQLFALAEEHAGRAGLSPEATASALAELEGWLAGISFTDLALGTLVDGVLDPTLSAVRQDFDDQPLVRASMEHALAGVFLELGLAARAEPPQRSALETRRAELGPEAPETLLSLHQLGLVLKAANDVDGGLELLDACLEIQERALGPDDPATLATASSIGEALFQAGRLEEARDRNARVLASRSRLLGEHHAATLDSMTLLGEALFKLYEYEQAEVLFEQALAGRRAMPDAPPLDLLRAMNNHALSAWQKGDLEGARLLLAEARALSLDRYGERHWMSQLVTSNLGSVLRYMGNLGAAEALLMDALSIHRTTADAVELDGPELLRQIGLLRQEQGRMAEADDSLEQAWLDVVRFESEWHQDAIEYASHLGELRLADERELEAEPVLVELAHHVLRNLEADDKRAELHMNNMWRLIPRLEQRLQALYQSSGASDEVLSTVNALAGAYNVMARESEAEQLLLAGLSSHVPAESGVSLGLLGEARSLLGEALAGQGRWGEAEPLLIEGFEQLEAHPHPGVEPNRLLRAARRLARFYEDHDQPESAADWNRRLDVMEGKSP